MSNILKDFLEIVIEKEQQIAQLQATIQQLQTQLQEKIVAYNKLEEQFDSQSPQK